MTQGEVLIGPLIERGGRYCYDIFTTGEGLRSSFSYRRLEEARHDRQTFCAEVRADPHRQLRICETLNEFLRLVEAASRGQEGDPGQAPPC
jgi:hypothetical protein